jgi:hypothetical protein
MTTGIRGIINNSWTTVHMVNREHTADSAVVQKRSTAPNAYAWIPQDSGHPIDVQTAKGTCSIWDESWYIKGKWDIDGGKVFDFTNAKDQHDYKLVVDEAGDITIVY